MASHLRKVKKLEERIAPSALGMAGGRPYPAGAPFPGYPSIDASGNVVFSGNVDGSVSGKDLNAGLGASGSAGADANAGSGDIDIGGHGTVNSSGGWNR